MDDGRLHAAAECVEPAPHRPYADTRPFQREDAYVVPTQPLPEIRESLNARDGMPEARWRHSVDEIDDAILHSSDNEMVENVENERRHRFITQFRGI